MRRSASTPLIAMLMLLMVCAEPSQAQHLVPPAAGIWQSQSSSYALSGAAQKRLLASLTRITGIERLTFDTEGRLELGTDSAWQKGSATARQILRDVLARRDVVVLEDHSDSGMVNFGQIEGMDYRDDATNQQAVVWWIRLDFADFQRIAAPPRVRMSFDEGFTLLHELLHALGHHDAPNPGEAGECETILNQVRAELGLPIRAEYFATPVRSITRSLVAIRLRFLDGRHGEQPRRAQDLQFALSILAPSVSRSAVQRQPD